jgi:hypothetical protein
LAKRSSAPAKVSAEFFAGVAPLTMKLAPGSVWNTGTRDGSLTQSCAHATRARAVNAASIEGTPIEDGRLRIAADRDLTVDVAPGRGRDAVAAVAVDRDPAVEVAAVYDDDRAVAGADKISLDRAVSGILSRPG